MLFQRFLPALLALAVCGAFAGCQPEDKIVKATRPRLNDMKRLVAGLVLPENAHQKGPITQRTWFFTLVGAESEIETLSEPFDEFLKSVRLDAADNPAWDLPKGWSQELDRGQKQAYATLHTGSPANKGPDVIVSVRKWPRLAENINFWRAHMSLKGLATLEQEAFCRPEFVNGRPAVVVDMTGPAAGPVLRPIDDDADPPITFQTPDNWEEIPPTSKFYVLSFVAQDGDQKADFNVSVSQGSGGGLIPNVNRWRGQVNLGDISNDQAASLPDVEIDNLKGKLVDITGTALAPAPNRILGAIVLRDKDSLFFKMAGPADLVGRQRPAFDAFLKSVRFKR